MVNHKVKNAKLVDCASEFEATSTVQDLKKNGVNLETYKKEATSNR